jgi:radical SAM superfamily enzyme YgiQ (UPF0313 family)
VTAHDAYDEVRARGWDEVDVVLVSGDAYVDHPSFGHGGRRRRVGLEAAASRGDPRPSPTGGRASPGGRSAVRACSSAIGAGNMDSMINHYTANKKVRNDDAYSPGGRIGLRPDRATLAYCQRAREAFKGVPVDRGRVEASLRRLAHYDYWSETVRGSILLDAKADLIVYGMAETTIVELARRLDAGEDRGELRDLRGVVYALGKRRPPDGEDVTILPRSRRSGPSKEAFARATRLIHLNSNPYNARTLVQPHGDRAVVCRPRRAAARAASSTGSTSCPTRARRTRATARRSRRSRSSSTRSDHARLLRRLHLLLDHHAPGPDHPVALAGLGPARARPHAPRTRTSRASSATSAARPPTCTPCAARSPRSRRPAGGCRACTRRSASCWARTTRP